MFCGESGDRRNASESCPDRPSSLVKGDHLGCKSLYVKRLDGIGPRISVSLHSHENTH